MRHALRFAILAAALTVAPDRARAADVVVLQCFFDDGFGHELTARTRSDGQGPGFFRGSCSQLLADALDDGYELALAHNGDLELPIFTLTRSSRGDRRRAIGAARSATTDVAILYCDQRLTWDVQEFQVMSSSSSAGTTAPASNCAFELAALLGDGFRLVDGSRGIGTPSILYTLVRGPEREPLASLPVRFPRDPVDAAQLKCLSAGSSLRVADATTSRDAPPVAIGTGTSCGEEIAELFRSGFEMVSVQAAGYDEATYTLARERGVR